MAKKVSESKTIMTQLVMPNDANHMGNLMGGNLLCWMDIAGAVCAGRHAESSVVTASVDHVSFQKPIAIGEVVTLEAKVTRAFNTSLEVYIEVYAASIKGQNNRKCNAAYLTFVALNDDTGKPAEVPDVSPLTEWELQQYHTATQRRELRLLLSGRIKPEEATGVKALFGV